MVCLISFRTEAQVELATVAEWTDEPIQVDESRRDRSALASVQTPEGVFVYLASNHDRGVSIFQLMPDNSLEFLDSVLHLDGRVLLEPRTPRVVQVGAEHFLAVQGFLTFYLFRINPDGRLSDGVELNWNGLVQDYQVVERGSEAYLYIAVDDGFFTYRLDEGGQLTQVGDAIDAQMIQFAHVRSGPNDFLLFELADYSIASSRVEQNGTLANAPDTLNLAPYNCCLQYLHRWTGYQVGGLGYLNTGGATFRIRENGAISQIDASYDFPTWGAEILTASGPQFAFVSDSTQLSLGRANPDGRLRLTDQNSDVFDTMQAGIGQPILVRNLDEVLAIAPVLRPLNQLAVYRVSADGIAEFLSSYGVEAPRHIPAWLAVGRAGTSRYVFGGDPVNNLISTFRADGNELELLHTTPDDPFQLVFAEPNQNPYVYSANGSSQQLNGYAVSEDGQLTLEHSLDIAIPRRTVLEHANLFGQDRLIGLFGEGLALISLGQNGELLLENQIELSMPTVSTLAISQVGERVFLYTSSGRFSAASQIAVYEIFANGSITFVDQIESSPVTSSGDSNFIETYSLGDQHYLVYTDGNYEGLSVFQIQSDGRLQPFGRVENSQSFPIGGLSPFEVFEFDGQVYLAQTGQGRGREGLSLLELDPDGRWRPIGFLGSGDRAPFLASIDIDFANFDGHPSLFISDIFPSSLIRLGFNQVQDLRLNYISAGAGLRERTNSDELVFDIGFSQAVQNVSLDDFDIVGTTANGSISGSGDRYSLSLSGGDLPALNGAVSLALRNSNDIQTLSGEPLGEQEIAISHTFQVDNTPNFIIPDSEILSARPSTYQTIDGRIRREFRWFSEFDDLPVNLAEEDLTVEVSEGVTVSSPIRVEFSESGEGVGRIEGHFNTPENTSGFVRMTINPNTDVLDSVGNGNGVNGYLPSYSVTIPYENFRPGGQIIGSAYTDAAYWIDIVFSESVDGLTGSGFNLVNAQLSDLSRVSENRYRALIEPLAPGNVTVGLLEGAVEDDFDNPSFAVLPLTTEYDPELPRLTTQIQGLGGGRLYSDIPGIDCGTDCVEALPIGTSVSVSASVDPGSSFAGWTAGPCVGQNVSSCDIVLTEDITVAARFVAPSTQPSQVFGAVLPAARSGNIGGGDLTAFATIISAGGSGAQSCRISANDNAPVSLRYWQVDETNSPIGEVSPVFDILAGRSMSFLLSLTPSSTTPDTGFEFFPIIACENGSMDPVSGINSLLVTIDAQQGPDVISINATPTEDGIFRVPFGGSAAFGAAGLNIGVGDGSTGNANAATVTVSADTGQNTSLPLDLTLCRTDAVTGACLASAAATVETIMPTSEAQTYSIFASHTSNSPIAFDPANARVFLRFVDANDVVRSVTSVAVMTYGADLPLQSLAGRWSVLVRHVDPARQPLSRGSLFIDETGRAVLDDGYDIRQIALSDFGVDPQTGLVSFEVEGQSGLLTSEGQIVTGQVFGRTQGSFWGVEDVRVPTQSDWSQAAGRYGDLYITASGEIRGAIGQCSIYGRSDGSAFVTLTLSGCSASGEALAVLDRPANDQAPVSLLISGAGESWRFISR